MNGLEDCLKFFPTASSSDSDLPMTLPAPIESLPETQLMWQSTQSSADITLPSHSIAATPAPTYNIPHGITAAVPGPSATPDIDLVGCDQLSYMRSIRGVTRADEYSAPRTSERVKKSSVNHRGYDESHPSECDYDGDNNSDDDPDFVLQANKKRKFSAPQEASPKQRRKRATTCNKKANTTDSPSPALSSTSLSTLAETSPSSVVVRAGKRLSERIRAASSSSVSSPSSSSTTLSPPRVLAPLPKRKHTAAQKRGQRCPCPIEGCSKTFSRDTDVKRHIESVHDSRRLEDILRETRDGLRTCCRWCNKLLARADACSRHEQDACRKNFESRWCQGHNVFAEGDKPTKKRRVAKDAGDDAAMAMSVPASVPAVSSVRGRRAVVPAATATIKGTRKSPCRQY
jgi:hypothetical protein